MEREVYTICRERSWGTEASSFSVDFLISVLASAANCTLIEIKIQYSLPRKKSTTMKRASWCFSVIMKMVVLICFFQ